jgi:hypothetical protein
MGDAKITGHIKNGCLFFGERKIHVPVPLVVLIK